ncbi:MAG TPA: hypothetical protein VGG75_00805 [Trebonia sp.]
MWSRGIAAVALCFVVATATLSGLPGPAPTLPAPPSREQASEQDGLMTALAQAPAAVAAWKRLHGGGNAGTGGGTTEKSSAGQDAAGGGQAGTSGTAPAPGGPASAWASARLPGASAVRTGKTQAAKASRQPRPPVLRRGGSRW